MGLTKRSFTWDDHWGKPLNIRYSPLNGKKLPMVIWGPGILINPIYSVLCTADLGQDVAPFNCHLECHLVDVTFMEFEVATILFLSEHRRIFLTYEYPTILLPESCRGPPRKDTRLQNQSDMNPKANTPATPVSRMLIGSTFIVAPLNCRLECSLEVTFMEL